MSKQLHHQTVCHPPSDISIILVLRNRRNHKIPPVSPPAGALNADETCDYRPISWHIPKTVQDKARLIDID